MDIDTHDARTRARKRCKMSTKRGGIKHTVVWQDLLSRQSAERAELLSHQAEERDRVRARLREGANKATFMAKHDNLLLYHLSSNPPWHSFLLTVIRGGGKSKIELPFRYNGKFIPPKQRTGIIYRGGERAFLWAVNECKAYLGGCNAKR